MTEPQSTRQMSEIEVAMLKKQLNEQGQEMGSPTPLEGATALCGAVIEVEWPGHRAVLSRRYCKAYPLKGFAHCRHHLSLRERRYLAVLTRSAAPPARSDTQ